MSVIELEECSSGDVVTARSSTGVEVPAAITVQDCNVFYGATQALFNITMEFRIARSPR